MKTEIIKTPAFNLVLIALLGLIVYSNTFNVPFQFDDIGSIIENPVTREFDYRAFIDRYVSYSTFALNYRLHGMEVAGYHAVNLAVHIATAILVYWLVILTFRTPIMSESSLKENSGHIALLSGFLFVCHPVQTQAVTYIVQRFASMAALFYLLSLVIYVKYRLGMLVRSSGFEIRREAGSVLLYVASLLCAVLAMKSKETAFTLPLAIVMYEFMFFEGRINKKLLYLGPLLLTILVIPLSLTFLRLSPYEALNRIAELTRVHTEMSRLEYLFTEFRVITTYIRLIFLPVNQNLDYDYPLYSSIFELPVLLSFIFLLGIFGVGICMLMRSRREAAGRLVAFGIFWFFLTLSVESSIIPIVDVINEHRLYLPSVGVFIALALGGFLLTRRISRNALRRTSAVVLVAVILIMSAATYARNTVWRSEISLWEDVVGKSPRKSRPYSNLGKAYQEAGMVDKAIAHMLTAINLDPTRFPVYYNLGNAYREKGLIDMAIKQYILCLERKPDYAEAHNNLGNAYRAKGLLDMAEAALKEALRLKPEYAEAHNNLGIVYREKGIYDMASESYKEALRLDPDYAEAHNNLAVLYAYRGATDKAIRHYLWAINLNPDLADSHYNLAVLYRGEGMLEDAARHYSFAISLNPAFRNAP
jgi:tetratricopeptide (TPR) repeat protein